MVCIDDSLGRPAFAREVWGVARRTTLGLFRVMIPMVILAKALKELGAIPYLAAALEPAMGVLGLPGSMGLVWATAMLTNIYGGLAVFSELAPAANLTVAQATVLGTVILVAHNLPVELRIVQRAGARLRFNLVWRLAGAFLLGGLLHAMFSLGGWLAAPNAALWQPRPTAPGLGAWAVDQAKSLGFIFLVILALVLLLKTLERLGVTAWLNRRLAPLLRWLGLSGEAAPVTVIGMTMGLAYGGGLIIEESRSGRMGERDVVSSLALLGLCHSLIEDTLLLAATGAHVSGILAGRVLFTLAAVALLARAIRRMPEKTFHKFLFRRSA